MQRFIVHKHVQEKIEAAELNALNKGKELAQKDILAKLGAARPNWPARARTRTSATRGTASTSHW